MAFLGQADLVAVTMILLYLSARKGVWTGTARPILAVFGAWVVLQLGIVQAIGQTLGGLV